MKQFLFLLIAIGSFCLAQAQQFVLPVTTKGFAEADIIFLKRYYGRDELVIDSVKGNRTAQLKISGGNGLYFLSAGKNATAEFVINTTEKISIEVNKEALKRGALSITGSPENEAYEKFVATYLAYDSAFYSIAAIKVDEFHSHALTRLKNKSADLEAVQQNLNSFLTDLQKQYPATYTATVLAPLAAHPLLAGKLSHDNYPAFLFHHFWQGAPLANAGVLNHFLLNEELKNYFRFFVPRNPDSIKVAIDIVLNKAATNTEVNAHVNSFLLRNFLKSNAEDLVLYVNSKNNADACGLNLSPAEMKKFEALKNLSAGAVAPDVLLPDREQKKIALKQVAAAHKVTLVLFWAAHCGKCRAELPYLKELYQKYKAQGLEVYAINIDENKFNWRDALDELQLAWINVSDEGQLKDSKVLEQFNIQHTPSLFLIDAKGLILDKEIYGNALNTRLAALLK